MATLPIGARVLLACQVRGARAMAKMSIQELAEESGVSQSSIRRIETVYGLPQNVTVDLLYKLQKYFEDRGFRFLWDDAPGIRWAEIPGYENPFRDGDAGAR